MPKRRAVEDSDNEDGLANGSTASKRARTADSDDSDAEVAPSTTRQSNKGKKRAQTRDNDDDEEDVEMEDEDDADETAEQFEKKYSDRIMASIRKRFSKKSTSGAIADHGIIESIEMHNFMCHKYLKMSFGPQINFIIGHNGSGKSAVLSAITVALGGKSTSTGRGSGLKSFIREGSQWSEVTVHIKNQGDEAFKPSEYGKSIAVTRRFTKDGGSTWKIKQGGDKRKDAKVISQKKDELAAICDHMNLQVDNPMSVLTQDAARQFLSASTASDKYNFFLKGTQLQQLSDEYTICLDNIQATTSILTRKGEAIPELREAKKEAERRFEEAKKARDQKKKIDELKREMAWSHVAEKQEELQTRMREKASQEARLPEIEGKIGVEKAAITTIETDVEKLHADLDALEDTGTLQAQKTDLQKTIKANLTTIQRLSSELNGMADQKREQEGMIKGYDQSIAETRARLAQHTDAKRLEREQKLNQARTDMENAEAILKNSETRQKASVEQEMSLRPQLELVNSNVHELQKKISNFDTDIHNATRAEKDQMSAYGNGMQRLLFEIQQARWYGDVPVGPLGVHVRARTAEWGQMLRKQLFQLLVSFTITDPRDRPLLKKMLANTKNNHCNIIISRKDNFDYSHGEPPEQFHTILRELEFDDENVLRIFINQRRIERTILARTRREAEHSMRQGLNGGGEAWTLDGFNVRVFPGGGNHSSPLTGGQERASPLLLAPRNSGGNIVESLREQKGKAEADLNAANLRLNGLEKEFRAAKTNTRSIQADNGRLHQRFQKAKTRYTTLQSEANEELPPDIAIIEAAKLECQAEIDSLTLQFEDVIKQKAPLDEANKNYQTQLNEIKKKLEQAENVRNNMTSKLEDTVLQRQTVQGNIAYWENKLAEEKAKVEKCESLVKVVTEEFTNWRAKALEYTGGIEVRNPRAAGTVKKQIEAQTRALEQREARQHASVEDLAVALEKATQAFRTAVDDHKQMNDLNNALKNSLTTRMMKWQEFRLHIALRCKHLFSYHLSQRGYFGKVLFSHTKGTLDLKVKTDEQMSGQNTREKDPRSLSGGEKSFSTICLLLSLWDAINCPLRCLDEFDVFMDAVNRRISMKMMIDTANASNQRQYVLITPQDMSNINHGPTVRIQRMADPERGQGVPTGLHLSVD